MQRGQRMTKQGTAALVLIAASTMGTAFAQNCFTLYDAQGRVIHQSAQPPFSVAWPEGSAERSASQARGEHLVISVDPICRPAALPQPQPTAQRPASAGTTTTAPEAPPRFTPPARPASAAATTGAGTGETRGPAPRDTQTQRVIKLSDTGICHPPGGMHYDRTITFTPFQTMDACIQAGGRRAQR